MSGTPVIDLFDPIHKPKSNYTEIKIEKTCMACFKKYEGQLWSKRCADCKAIDAPFRRNLNEPKKEFTGRLYKSPKTGKSYPSVTSILNYEGIDYPQELLVQYGSRGTIVHKQVEEFIKTGSIIDPLTTPELASHVKIVTEGSLKLKWADCNYQGFLEKYRDDFTFDFLEGMIINDEHEYGGRVDCEGTYLGEPAIIDWKTAGTYTEDKIAKYFAQLSAYAMAIGHDVKYLVVVPLNPKTGFDAPIVSTHVEKHFNHFLDYRKKFREIYDK